MRDKERGYAEIPPVGRNDRREISPSTNPSCSLFQREKGYGMDEILNPPAAFRMTGKRNAGTGHAEILPPNQASYEEYVKWGF